MKLFRWPTLEPNRLVNHQGRSMGDLQDPTDGGT